MHIIFLLIGITMVAACSPASNDPITDAEATAVSSLSGVASSEAKTDASSLISSAISSSSTSTQTINLTLEKYPEEFSVDHFRNMALSGTDLVIGHILEQPSGYTKYYLTYLSNTVKISGTIAIPHDDGPFPLVILNHGYIDPAVYTNGRGLKREQAALARAGFAVLHTDYRKHAQSDPDPDTRDIYDNALAYALDSANAVLAVRELGDPRIDASKIGMMGHSMGGGVTQHILVAHPELIDAAVLYAPISPVAWQNFDRWRGEDYDKEDISLIALGTQESNPSAWLALSQTGSLNLIADPVLLFHGTADKDVPVEWSHNLDRHLTALGKNMTYVEYAGEGHEFGGRWQEFINDTIAFFRQNLAQN